MSAVLDRITSLSANSFDRRSVHSFIREFNTGNETAHVAVMSPRSETGYVRNTSARLAIRSLNGVASVSLQFLVRNLAGDVYGYGAASITTENAWTDDRPAQNPMGGQPPLFEHQRGLILEVNPGIFTGGPIEDIYVELTWSPGTP